MYINIFFFCFQKQPLDLFFSAVPRDKENLRNPESEYLISYVSTKSGSINSSRAMLDTSPDPLDMEKNETRSPEYNKQHEKMDVSSHMDLRNSPKNNKSTSLSPSLNELSRPLELPVDG